jgi:hypothetical protein
MEAEYKHWLKQRQQFETKRADADGSHGFKRRKADDGLPLIELPVRFDKYAIFL